MENILPKITEKFYQRKQAVMIASEYADIVITDFPYQVWIEEDKICLEKTALDRGHVFYNEQELDQGQAFFEIDFREGDCLYFSQGSIAVYRNYLVIAMTEDCYESTLLELAPNQVTVTG